MLNSCEFRIEPLTAQPSSRKQDRRELAPAGKRGFIGHAPGIEKLEQLLTRGVVTPAAVGFDDRKQMVRRLGTPSLGIADGGKIEPRLVVLRVACQARLEFGGIAERSRLFGKLDLGTYRSDRRRVLLVLGNAAEHRASRLLVARLEEQVRKAGCRVGIVGRLLQQGR